VSARLRTAVSGKCLLTKDPGHPDSNLLLVEEMLVSKPIGNLVRGVCLQGACLDTTATRSQSEGLGQKKKKTGNPPFQTCSVITITHVKKGITRTSISVFDLNANSQLTKESPCASHPINILPAKRVITLSFITHESRLRKTMPNEVKCDVVRAPTIEVLAILLHVS
jgi:hypothetical protein